MRKQVMKTSLSGGNFTETGGPKGAVTGVGKLF